MRCSNHDANQDACFTFEDPYNAALERVRSSQVCELLEDVEVNGFAVVDDPEAGRCAGGDGVLFKQALTEVVED